MARSLGEEQTGILGTDRLLSSLVCGNASAHLKKRQNGGGSRNRGGDDEEGHGAGDVGPSISAATARNETSKKDGSAGEGVERDSGGEKNGRSGGGASQARAGEFAGVFRPTANRVSSHGGGRGGHGRGAGGYRVPISGMKMVQCCLSNVAC